MGCYRPWTFRFFTDLKKTIHCWNDSNQDNYNLLLDYLLMNIF
jgi:hypothetical protein